MSVSSRLSSMSEAPVQLCDDTPIQAPHPSFALTTCHNMPSIADPALSGFGLQHAMLSVPAHLTLAAADVQVVEDHVEGSPTTSRLPGSVPMEVLYISEHQVDTPTESNFPLALKAYEKVCFRDIHLCPCIVSAYPQ